MQKTKSKESTAEDTATREEEEAKREKEHEKWSKALASVKEALSKGEAPQKETIAETMAARNVAAGRGQRERAHFFRRWLDEQEGCHQKGTYVFVKRRRGEPRGRKL